jgi:hypothetical protein
MLANLDFAPKYKSMKYYFYLKFAIGFKDKESILKDRYRSEAHRAGLIGVIIRILSG